MAINGDQLSYSYCTESSFPQHETHIRIAESNPPFFLTQKCFWRNIPFANILTMHVLFLGHKWSHKFRKKGLNDKNSIHLFS
jgi:hypothetical protein